MKKKIKITINKLVYLSIYLGILDLIKTVIYEFWYYHINPVYSERTKLCYINTDSFIVHIKTNEICKDISEDVEKRFDTSNYDIDRPFPKGRNKKVVGLMNNELGGQTMKKIVGLRP